MAKNCTSHPSLCRLAWRFEEQTQAFWKKSKYFNCCLLCLVAAFARQRGWAELCRMVWVILFPWCGFCTSQTPEMVLLPWVAEAHGYFRRAGLLLEQAESCQCKSISYGGAKPGNLSQHIGVGETQRLESEQGSRTLSFILREV